MFGRTAVDRRGDIENFEVFDHIAIDGELACEPGIENDVVRIDGDQLPPNDIARQIFVLLAQIGIKTNVGDVIDILLWCIKKWQRDVLNLLEEKLRFILQQRGFPKDVIAAHLDE